MDPSRLQGSAKEWSLGCVIPASWPLLAAGRVSRNLVTIHKPIPVDRAIRASGVFGVLTLGAILFGKERETQYRVARTHKGRKDERQKEGGRAITETNRASSRNTCPLLVQWKSLPF